MAYLNVLREVLPHNAIVTDELSQVGFTPGTASRSTSRALSLPQAIRARSARAFPAHSAPRWRIRTGRWSRSPAMALHVRRAGIGDRSAVQHRRGDAGVSTTTPMATSGATSASVSTAGWASDLVNPDFVKLAESFGVAAARVTSPETFRAALEKALAHGGPYLIDIEVPKDSETSPWTFIHPAKP